MQLAEEVQKYTGIAPVTERSGNKCWVHWRLQCPKFLRQTFVEWAALSIPHCYWAKAYYEQQRAGGSTHQVALRALAFKWIRIVYRCWQNRTPVRRGHLPQRPQAPRLAAAWLRS